MYGDVYYVDKVTGTASDVYRAYGLASVFSSVVGAASGGRSGSITLEDGHHCYIIRLPVPLCEADVQAAPRFIGFDFLKGYKDEPPAGARCFDMPAEAERRKAFFAAREAQRANRAPGAEELAEQLAPSREWGVYEAISRLKAATTYNSLYRQLLGHGAHYRALLEFLLLLHAASPNRRQEVERALAAYRRSTGLRDLDLSPTALALFNPMMGKGQNEGKPDTLRMSNVNSFLLDEWLKYVGYFQCAHAMRIANPRDKKAQDRKVYSVAPVNLRLQDGKDILTSFRAALLPATSVKQDILASLAYAREFLNYMEVQSRTARPLWRWLSPHRYVRGLHVSFFKDLGQSAAVMNLCFIGLPNWMDVTTGEEADLYRDLLEEHRLCIRSLDEERSPHFRMLERYRDFLSSGDLDDFLEFSVSYAGHLMQAMDRKEYNRQFTVNNLGRLIMGSNRKLSEIVEDPGFRNLAYAIRRSTVSLQYQKARTSNHPAFEIRYGLAQELKKTADRDGEFLAKLADFVGSYNAENARLAERSKVSTEETSRRRNVATSDLDSIVRLVDDHGAKLVCNLLVAYGYASAREESPRSSPSEGGSLEGDAVAEEEGA